MNAIPAMINVLQIIIDGLLVGLVYGLVAVSFVVIYRASRIVNLAQGEVLRGRRAAALDLHARA